MRSQLLSQLVRDILPSASIEAQSIPGCSALQLYLLNADYPQHSLSQAQMLRLMDEPFYWAFCWASGAVLAAYILDNPQLVAGRRVVDFGCGSAVVAIAAAKAGAREVIACDIDPLALQASRENAVLNQVNIAFCDDFMAIEGDVDLIIVADVLYDRSNYPWLSLFAGRAAGVLLADSRVKNFDFPAYDLIARREARTVPDLDESREFGDVRIYQNFSA